MNFSPDELSLIQKQRKPDDLLPKYYSINQKTYFPISRDFEAYLILQRASAKQYIQRWIKTSKKLQYSQADRDELLNIYLTNRQTDAQAQLDEIDAALAEFSEFKNGLFTSGEDSSRFSGLLELGLLTNSLQRPMEEIAHVREQIFHEKVMADFQLATIEVESSLVPSNFSQERSLDIQKDLEAWQGVVAAYPGNKG